MKVLKITWTRIIISFFAGGLLNETIFHLTGDATRPRPNDQTPFVLFYALMVYLVLTWYVKIKNRTPPL